MDLQPSTSLATPKVLAGESTVFMTPSSSTGKPVYSRPSQITPLPLSFLSPAPSPLMKPERSQQQRDEECDIVGRLYLEGFPLPCEKILSFLSPSDLQSSLRVCQTWNRLITSSSKLMDKIHTHKTPSPTVSSTKQPPRPALASLTNSARSLPSSSSTALKKPSTHHPLTQTSLKFRPCPSCQSPAKELNLRRAECTRCSLDFCQDCFKPWHAGECARVRSPRRKERSADICGTKKSKKRLRRL